MKFHQVLLSLFLAINSVDAYPTGAGQCVAGDMAPQHGVSSMGTLESSGKLQFMVDGKAPDTDDLITAGTEHTLKID